MELSTQIYAQHDGNHIVNSLITLAIGYLVYIPLFAFLFYRDNKAKYVDPLTGRKNSNKIRNDVKKLFTAFSISEAIFIVSKTYIHYYLLVSSVEPYLAYTFCRIYLMDNIPHFNQFRHKGCKIIWKLTVLDYIVAKVLF